MTYLHRTGYVNPKLGTFFGIFMAAFVAIALLTLIFEGLGVPSETLRLAMLFGPFALYAAIGAGAFTHEPLDYFASGRRVPAFYTGLVLAQTAMGATGLLAITGAFFHIGFDTLCLVIGGLAGFVVMAVMLAPFFRKFGAYTVPSYLGRRFDSRVLRLAAAGILAVPMLLMLSAELSMGAYAASWLIGEPRSVVVMLLVATLLVTITAGGMRSLSWCTSAECIASLIALIVPVVVVAILVTNLPFPQLSAGPVLRVVSRAEAAQGLPIILPPALAFDMPGQGLAAIAKRYSDAFGSVGPVAFVIVTLSTLAGIAGAPWLLPRVAATPGVYEARKSLGWATLLFGVTMLTMSAAAIFMRDALMDIVTVSGTVRFPDWFNALKENGIVDVATSGSARPTLSDISMTRDAVLLSLPSALDLPQAVIYLAAAGAIAAALATAGTLAVALGNLLSEDVVHGLSWTPVASTARLVTSRLALSAAAVLGGLIAISAPTDPLRLMLWALALTASSAFPILILSIWWKRLNAFGAIAGLATGFAITVLAIIAGESGWIGLESPLAAVLGLPAGAATAVIVTLMTPAPTRHALELVRDIRIPGGEILYDREMRFQRRQKNQRGAA